MAMQLNYFLDHGAFHANADGTFAVDIPKMKAAVTGLAHDLLTLEAQGDYAKAKHMLDTLAVLRQPVQAALGRLEDIPTDIEPVYTTADMLTHARKHPWAD